MLDASEAAVPVRRLAADTIRLERMLDTTPEKLWRYLTEAELRGQWFHGGTDARADGAFDIVINHDPLSSDDAPYPEAYAGSKGRTLTERVLRFDPPRLLETTFAGGSNGSVLYELFPEGERTRLVITHSGITSPTGAQNFGSGWTSHLAVLEALLQGRRIANFWALHEQSEAAVEKALGA